MVTLRLALLVVLAAPAAAQRPPPTPAERAAQAEGHLVRAVAALTLDNDSAAVRHAEAALAVAPGASAPLDVLAEAYLALGQTTDALYHAALAAQAAPDEASLHLRLALAQRAVGQRDAALASAETAARLSPTDAAAALLLADLYSDANRPADAVAAVQRLTQTFDDPDLWMRLAVLHERAGQADLAAADRRAAGVRAPSTTPTVAATASGGNADAALATVAADPRRLDAWAAALTALAAASDPRAGDTADEATLLFPTVPSILAPAAEAYLAAQRPADAARAARAGLASLDAAPDAALRVRLERALATAIR